MPTPPSVASFLAGTAVWTPTSISTGDWGRLQIVIAGTDVTFFRGVPCVVESWGSQEPFGDDQAIIDFPQVLQFDTLGPIGDTTVPWAFGGAAAQVNLVRDDNSTKTLFAGYVQILGDYYSTQSGSGTSTTNGSAHYLQVTLQGTMYQAALCQLTPYFAVNIETSNGVADAGALITTALNNAIGRRWGYCVPVTTGFKLAINGSFINVLEYVQDTLGQCLKIDGTTQYTIDCDPTSGVPPVPVLKQKDVSTVNWTVDAGAPGVDTSGLTDDETLNTNVCYGSGTTPQGVTTPFNLELFGIATGFSPGGETFMGSKFPSFSQNTGLPYPFVSAGSTIGLGTSDNAPGMTVTPNGVSVLQEYLGDPVTGTYNATDAATVEAIQAKNGIQVDGVVGPQTWEAIFNVASNTGGAAIVLPLYELHAAVGPGGSQQDIMDPWSRNGQGGIIAANPYYDPNILRVEAYLGMGAGITLPQAVATATAVVNRDYQASWAGTIVLTTDPHEGSRFEIRAGQNINLRYFHGVTQLFHVNAVEVAFDTAPSISTGVPSTQPTLQVTLTVDTAARDNVTSKNMVAHEPGSPGDPVRRSQTLKRKSRYTNDTVIQFDSSAGAGVVPPHAIYSGLWTVLKIPFGQLGQIAKTTYGTSSSITNWAAGRTGYPFYVAVFNQPVTANAIVSILGNGGDPTQVGIWQTQSVALKAAGLEISWGGNAGYGLQPCGYWPLTLQLSGPLTGNFVDDDLWSYASSNPPWLWVCEYSPNACFIRGVFEQAVGGTPG
jgi:peptidoglycan hydrolase-like protein with peptidoglycan-binding domain